MLRVFRSVYKVYGFVCAQFVLYIYLHTYIVYVRTHAKVSEAHTFRFMNSDSEMRSVFDRQLVSPALMYVRICHSAHSRF